MKCDGAGFWGLGLGIGRLGFAMAACIAQPQPDAYGKCGRGRGVVRGRRPADDIHRGGRANACCGRQGGPWSIPTQLTLQRGQVIAQRDAAVSRVSEINNQAQALSAQRDALQAQQAAVARSGGLFSRSSKSRAATTSGCSGFSRSRRPPRSSSIRRNGMTASCRIKSRRRTSKSRRNCDRWARRARSRAAAAPYPQTQIAAVDAQVAQLDDRIRRAAITNPSAGTVLVTYAKPGEVVQPGSRSRRSPMWSPSMSRLRHRAAAGIGEDRQAGAGQRGRRRQAASVAHTVSWVSTQAEFTPTPIQTRDERADLVYAVKIRVPSVLKIGMPSTSSSSNECGGWAG